MCTSPLEMPFSQSHSHVVPFTNLILPCLNLVLEIIFHALIFSFRISTISTMNLQLFFSPHVEFFFFFHSCCHCTPIWSLKSTVSRLQFSFFKGWDNFFFCYTITLVWSEFYANSKGLFRNIRKFISKFLFQLKHNIPN